MPPIISGLSVAPLKAGMEQIPVISLSVGMEKNSGFRISPGLLRKGLYSVVIGDVFMRVLYATRPYEDIPGSADELHRKWAEKVKEEILHSRFSRRRVIKLLKQIIREFDELPRKNMIKPRVGVVGEILVKFMPMANNDIVLLLEREGAEAVMPDLLDFVLYFAKHLFKVDNYSESKISALIATFSINLIEYLRKTRNTGTA